MYGFDKIKQKNKIFAYSYLVLLGVTCGVLYFFTKVVSVVSLLPFSCFFILFGMMLKKAVFLIQDKKCVVLICSIILFSATVSVNYSINKSDFDFSSMNMGTIPLYILSCIFGSIALFCFSMYIENIKLLSIIGKDSLYYYGFHYEILSAVKEVIPYSVIQGVVTFLFLFPIVSIYILIKNKITKRKNYD